MTTDAVNSTEPEPGALRQQAVTGVVWTTLEKWTVRLSTLIGFIILGNLLSPLEFGVVALAMTFINFLTKVADGGLAAYVLQKKNLTDAVTHTAFITTSAMALVLALALAALAPPLSRALDVAELRSVLPALALALFISGMSTVPAVLLSRELRFKQLALRQIVAAGISVVAAVALALSGAGVWALVGQTIVRGVVSFVILWATTDYRPRWEFQRAEARAMAAYGAKALPVQLQIQMRSQGEMFIIGALSGPVTLGYWTVAGRLVAVIVDVFSSVVGAVAHPVFARLQDTPERLTRAIATSRGLSALVLVPALVLMALVSEEVVPAVFGEQWAPTTTVASLLALFALLQSMGSFDRSALLATGHPGPELVITSVFLVVQLGAVVVLHSDLELLAAALTATLVISLPIRLVMVRHLLGVPVSSVRDAASILLAGGIAAAAVVGAQVALGLEGLAYVVMAVLLGGVVYAGVVMVVARSVVREAMSIGQGLLRRRARRGQQTAAA